MHKGKLTNVNPPRITTEPKPELKDTRDAIVRVTLSSIWAQFENLGELVKNTIFVA